MIYRCLKFPSDWNLCKTIFSIYFTLSMDINGLAFDCPKWGKSAVTSDSFIICGCCEVYQCSTIWNDSTCLSLIKSNYIVYCHTYAYALCGDSFELTAYSSTRTQVSLMIFVFCLYCEWWQNGKIMRQFWQSNKNDKRYDSFSLSSSVMHTPQR